MAIETKEFYAGTNIHKKEVIDLRKNFGWTYLRDEYRGRTHSLYIILSRDKDMPNYGKLRTLEVKYDEAAGKLKTYSPITDSPEMFLLILLFVFPFVIYCIYKSKQKQEINENNERLRKEMAGCIEQAKVVMASK